MAYPMFRHRRRAASHSATPNQTGWRVWRWRRYGLGLALALGSMALPAIAQPASKIPKDFSPGAIATALTRGDWAWVAIGVILILALGFHLLLAPWGRRYLLPRIKKWFPPPPPPTTDTTIQPPRRVTPEAVFQLVLLGARIVLWLGVAFLITRFFPVARRWSDDLIENIVDGFTADIISLGRESYALQDMILLVLMVLALVIGSKIIADLFKARILSLARINRGAQEAIAVILRYTLLVIGMIVLLPIWGLDLSSFAILASALGVGIGFGFQDIAKNFGSGIVLIFERPIQVGDFVEVGEFLGTIERIGARSTLIRTLDQVSIIIPNSRFLEDEVINWSHDNPVSRLHLPVGVSYSSDVETVRSVLLEAAKNHPFILSHPKPSVLFQGFGDSSLDFELLVWTRDPSKQLFIKSDLNFRIERLFREHQVEIPFPQRDLHVRSGTLPITVPDDLSVWLRHQANGDRPATTPTSQSPTDPNHSP
jgi:small-conductance mechanosensitive channel